jgi:hypothetical protein
METQGGDMEIRTDFAALGLKTLHIGQTEVRCSTDAYWKHMVGSRGVKMRKEGRGEGGGGGEEERKGGG